MRNIWLALVTILLLLSLLGLHMYAIDLHLYIRFPFLDIIAHFLGGVCLALSTFYVLRKTRNIIIITLLLGIAWEVFEVYFDITGWSISSPEYKVDTIIDLIMDTLGAITVWFLVKNNKKNEHIPNIS